MRTRTLTPAEMEARTARFHKLETRIVRGKATARRLVAACTEIAARGYGEYGDVDEFIDEVSPKKPHPDPSADRAMQFEP